MEHGTPPSSFQRVGEIVELLFGQDPTLGSHLLQETPLPSLGAWAWLACHVQGLASPTL